MVIRLYGVSAIVSNLPGMLHSTLLSAELRTVFEIRICIVAEQ
jgi:hypothetical protein